MEPYEHEEKVEARLDLKRRPPWTDYNLAVQKNDIELSEIKNRILISSKINHRYAACVALLYLSASRIHEILPYKYKGKYADKFPPISKAGIKIKDIDEKFDGDIAWVYITTRIEKLSSHRGDIGESDNGISLNERYKAIIKDETKTAKIPFDKDFPDFELLNLVKDYVMNLQEYENRDIDEEDEIFPNVTYLQMNRFLKEYIKITPHVLRHLRMHHMKTHYGLDLQDLQAYGGWKSVNMVMKYSKSNTQQIGDKFLKYMDKQHNMNV